MTTPTPVTEKVQPWALGGGPTLSLSCSQPIPGSRPATLRIRRSRRSSRRSSLDGPPGPSAAASVRPNEVRCSAACTAVRRIVCALRQHISSRLHPRIRLRRSIMPPAPCRPPLADVRGRARCFFESTAPHQPPMRNRQPTQLRVAYCRAIKELSYTINHFLARSFVALLHRLVIYDFETTANQADTSCAEWVGEASQSSPRVRG